MYRAHIKLLVHLIVHVSYIHMYKLQLNIILAWQPVSVIGIRVSAPNGGANGFFILESALYVHMYVLYVCTCTCTSTSYSMFICMYVYVCIVHMYRVVIWYISKAFYHSYISYHTCKYSNLPDHVCVCTRVSWLNINLIWSELLRAPQINPGWCQILSISLPPAQKKKKKRKIYLR